MSFFLKRYQLALTFKVIAIFSSLVFANDSIDTIGTLKEGVRHVSAAEASQVLASIPISGFWMYAPDLNTIAVICKTQLTSTIIRSVSENRLLNSTRMLNG